MSNLPATALWQEFKTEDIRRLVAASDTLLRLANEGGFCLSASSSSGIPLRARKNRLQAEHTHFLESVLPLLEKRREPAILLPLTAALAKTALKNKLFCRVLVTFRRSIASLVKLLRNSADYPDIIANVLRAFKTLMTHGKCNGFHRGFGLTLCREKGFVVGSAGGWPGHFDCAAIAICSCQAA